MWIWKHQWPLEGCQNKIITISLLAWALWLAIEKGDSFVGVFNLRCDQAFVGVLRKWHRQIWPDATSSKNAVID
jgi:hypothetical protein